MQKLYQKSKTTFKSSCYCHVSWDNLYFVSRPNSEAEFGSRHLKHHPDKQSDKENRQNSCLSNGQLSLVSDRQLDRQTGFQRRFENPYATTDLLEQAYRENNKVLFYNFSVLQTFVC